MTKPRLICWFSCGAASAVSTKLAIAQYKDSHEIVIARCIVIEEHSDNDRFAADCEKWFGLPVTNMMNEKYNGSIVEVADQRKYVSGIAGAPCTMLLKKKVREDFQRPTDKHVFGYCSEEQDRWDSFLDANNIDAVSPLIDRGLEHSDCLAMVENANIKLPIMYGLGYKHNNCIGCWKASGQGYWNKVKVDFPLTFAHRAEQSRRIGARLLNVDGVHKFLDEIEIGAGNYQKEPEIQCGIFCEMAQKEYA